MQTKRVEIAELEGAALDWAVLESIGGETDWELSRPDAVFATWDDLANSERFSPSIDWSQCGSLIHRYRMTFVESPDGLLVAMTRVNGGANIGMEGGDHLIAACRTVVAAHNPDGYVGVPVELMP